MSKPTPFDIARAIQAIPPEEDIRAWAAAMSARDNQPKFTKIAFAATEFSFGALDAEAFVTLVVDQLAELDFTEDNLEPIHDFATLLAKQVAVPARLEPEDLTGEDDEVEEAA